MTTKNPESETSQRASKTMFYLMMPTLILAILSFMDSYDLKFGYIIILIVTKILLVYWQYASLKNFIESVY